MTLLTNKIDSWVRFGFVLVVFWAILCFTDMLLTDIAAFNSLLDGMVQKGYVTGLRGIMLFLVFAAAIIMTALLRRGLVIAPIIWIAQVIRICITVNFSILFNNLFLSPGLSIFLLMVVPVLLAVTLWKGLDLLDSSLEVGVTVIPGLWLLLTALISTGSYFVWHWSGRFSVGLWPSGYGLIVLVIGLMLLIIGAKRPGASFTLFFSGLMVPSLVYILIWGLYDGLALALISFLPFGQGSFVGVWLELMLLTALPLLLLIGANQFLAWRKGEELLRIY